MPGQTIIEPKIARQMSRRGWTHSEIESTLANPHRIVDTTDMRWRADGSKRNDPAKAYIREDGHYIVRNEVDGTVVQISNRHKPNWKSPFESGKESMSKGDELEAAFASKASFSDTPEFLFTRDIALEVIEACAKEGILILGMDFYVRDGQDYKELLSSADFSELKGKPDAVHHAVMSAKKLIAEGLPDGADFVSFVLDDEPAF